MSTTIKDSAICIRRWAFSETSQTLSLLTEAHGVIRGLAKGARRERGSFSGGVDILNRGHLVAIVKPGLATLTQWHLERTYTILRDDLAANRAGWYMADLIHHMVREQDPHPEVFRGLCAALEAMSEGAAPASALLAFQWLLLRETGYQPQVAVDAETGARLDESRPTFAFSAAAGGVVADTGADDRWRVRASTVSLLRALAAREDDTPLAEADADTLDRANRLLGFYLREIIGAEPASMRWAFP